MSDEELLGEIKRHIDYTNAMNEKSLRDLQIENLYNLLQKKEKIIKEVREEIEENTYIDKKGYLIKEGTEYFINPKVLLEILDKEN